MCFVCAAGLYGGSHAGGGLKARKATKAAAEGKSLHWRTGTGSALGRPLQRVPRAEALVHATKKGRCQKVKKTATRTLPAVSPAASTDARGKFGDNPHARPEGDL
jgi:hypothetical protein